MSILKKNYSSNMFIIADKYSTLYNKGIKIFNHLHIFLKKLTVDSSHLSAPYFTVEKMLFNSHK